MNDNKFNAEKENLRDYIFETVSKTLNENSIKEFSEQLVELLKKEFPQKDIDFNTTLKKSKVTIDGVLFEIFPDDRQDVVYEIVFKRFKTWSRPDKSDYDSVKVREPNSAVDFIKRKVKELLGEINKLTEKFVGFEPSRLQAVYRELKKLKPSTKKEKNKKNLYLKVIKEVSSEKYNFLNNMSKKKKLREIVRKEVKSVFNEVNFSDIEIGLTAPEDADYELERVVRGYTLHEAFHHLREWAENNGYSVERTGDGTSIWDYTFSKNGSNQYITVLNR